MLHEKTIDLQNRIVEFIKKNTPIESGDGKSLYIEKISFTEPDALNSIYKQLELKYDGKQSLVGQVKGSIVIKSDKSGKVLSSSGILKLFPIYYVTDRNTYIVGGNEKNILNSMILNPGVYTEKNAASNVVTSSFMFDKMHSSKYMPPIDIVVDPVNIKFDINVGMQTKSSFNGINFLREFGFSDTEIAKMIGNNQVSDALFAKNKGSRSVADIAKAVTGKAPTTTAKAREELMNFLEENAIFGDSGKKVNKATLGLESSRVTKDVILKAVTKAFGVARNDVEQDDKSDLRFKPILSDNDLMMRELETDFIKFKNNAIEGMKKGRSDWSKIRDVAKLGSSLDTFMSRDSLSQNSEQTNPLFMASINNRVTQLADSSKGGISPDAKRNIVKPRNLKQSAVNRIDPVETPESSNIGLVEHLTQAAILKNKTVYIPVLKVKNGSAIDSEANTVELSPNDEYDVRVAYFDGRYVKKDGNTIRFTQDIVPARYKGKTVNIHVSEINYVDKAAQNLLNFTANMIPYVGHNDGNRAMMGTNMQRQAILLKNREIPLVMTSVNGSAKTYEELIGELHGKPVRSKVEGIVKEVNDKEIIIKDDEDKLHNYQYYNYFKLNQSFMHNEITVKVGDRVKPGQIIAEGWSTRDGKLALGMNARVGYLPYKGYNYEDGIVISKSFANRMATEEVGEKVIDLKADLIGGKGSAGLNQFKRFAKDPDFTNLDDDGIIKVGSKFGPGSTLVGWLKPKPKKNDQTGLEKLINFGSNVFFDYEKKTIPRTSYEEGVVKRIHIVNNPEPGIKQRIYITYANTNPLKLGDKLSGKHGNKGTITRILPTDEMPAADGKPLDIIFSPLAVPSRKNLGQLLEVGAGLIAEKTGKSIVVNNFDHTEKDKVLDGLKKIGIPDGKMTVTLKEKDINGKISEIETDNPVTVGNIYIMKLKHKVDDKIQARSNLENNPSKMTYMPQKEPGLSKGERFNPQKFGEMEQRALQAHGAVWNILESSTIKADGAGDRERRKAIFSALSTGKFDALDYPATPETVKVLADSLRVLGLDMKPVNDGMPATGFDDAFNGISLVPIKPSQMIKMIGSGNQVTEYGLGFKAKIEEKEDKDKKKKGKKGEKSKEDSGEKEKGKKKKKGEKEEAIAADIAIAGGLHDPIIFGDDKTEDNRRKWGYIKLKTPMPNPVMFKSVSYNPYSLILNRGANDLKKLFENKHVLIIDPDKWTGYESKEDKRIGAARYKETLKETGLEIGDIVPAAKIEELEEKTGREVLWKAGGEGLQHMLDHVDLDSEISNAKLFLKSAKSGDVDRGYKRYKALMALKTNNLKPADLMLHYIPVAPTYLRPAVRQKDTTYIHDDLNKLYSNIIFDSRATGEHTNGFNMIESDTVADAASYTNKVYRGVSDLFGRTQHVDPRKKIKMLGVYQKLKGKEGLIRGDMLSKSVDFSGRSVIGVDPKLSINQVGIPYDMARVIYKPFIFKDLLDSLKVTNEKEAQTKWENSKDPDVRAIIAKISKDRPVIINRQPSLHKFSVQAYDPVIRERQDGEIVRSIQLNPLVVTGFNADFDGDSIFQSIYVRYNASFEEIDIRENNLNGASIKIDIKNKDGIRYKISNFMEEYFMPFTESVRYVNGLVHLRDFPRGNLLETRGNKEKYSVPEGIEVLTVRDGVVKWLPVESYSVHKDLNMLEVTTNTSRTLRCSDDHSLVTVDEELNYTKHKAQKGITLPRLREPVASGGGFTFFDVMTIGDGRPNGRDSILATLDSDFGWFNGAFIGNGWTNAEIRPDEICVSTTNKNIVRKIETFFTKLLKRKITMSCRQNSHTFNGHECYSETHYFSDAKISNYLRNNLGIKAENKHLPFYWVNTRETFRWGLLAGLIDTDGSVSISNGKKTPQTNINYTTVSVNLADEIVALAHSLNLTASVTVSQTPKGDPCYYVTFTQESIEIIRDKMNLVNPDKNAILKAFIPAPNYKRNKYTPKLSKERLEELRKLIGSPRTTDRKGNVITNNVESIKKRKSLYSVVYRVMKEDSAVTRQTALDIFDLDLDIFKASDFWAKWKEMVLDERIEWELVTDMKPIPFITEAYDLTIPPAYTMVTESGIVVYDTMAIHVPITEKAKEEATRLMQPSTNLINPTDGKMIIEIRHEMALGIYYLTMNFNKLTGNGLNFGSYSDLRKAYKEGRITARTRVSIAGLSNVTAGQAMFLLLIPEKYRGADKLRAWSSSDIQKVLVDIYRECEKTKGASMPLQKVSQIIDDIKRLGFEASTRSGISIGITDFRKMEDAEEIFRRHVNEAVKESKDPSAGVITGWRNAEKEIQKTLEVKGGDILGEDNPIKIIMTSGARAKPDQVRRMMVSVGVGSDVENRLTAPVEHSHLDGLSPQEFWLHSYDARKGMYDRSVSTSAPGALSREIWSATQDIVIREKDCDSKDGIPIDINRATVLGRYLAEDVITEKDGTIAKRNDVVTYDLRKKAFDDGIKYVKVRSPLKCKTVHGLCQKCYGALPGTMKLPPLGMAVGVLASQAMGEPVTQMTMNTFHSGGTSSSATLGLPRIESILSVSSTPDNKAVLAENSGEVNKIETGPKGTSDVVFINNKKHVVPHTFEGEARLLKVNVGDRVTAGDFLTHGDLSDLTIGDKMVINNNVPMTNADPEKLLKLKTEAYDQEVALDYTQNYLTKGMEYAFDKTIGEGKIDSRHLETIVSKLTSVVTIVDSGDSDYTKGEVIAKNVADQWNAINAGPYSAYRLPIAQASKVIGKTSLSSFKDKNGEFIIKKGENFNSQNIGRLLLSNIKEVNVQKRPIKYSVRLESLETVAPKGHENWFSNLGHRNVFEQLARGATLGQTEKLEDPRARFMAGKLLRVGQGYNYPKVKADTVSSKMFNLFSKKD